jgi:hypothetical protein
MASASDDAMLALSYRLTEGLCALAAGEHWNMGGDGSREDPRALVNDTVRSQG